MISLETPRDTIENARDEARKKERAKDKKKCIATTKSEEGKAVTLQFQVFPPFERAAYNWSLKSIDANMEADRKLKQLDI